MLQNILEYWKLKESLIVNYFDKPYIVIVFASGHLLMDTARFTSYADINCFPSCSVVNCWLV